LRWPFANLFEKKSISNPTSDDFAILAPYRTSPLSVTPVANAVRLLSEGAATLEIKVVKRGDVPIKVDHPALSLLTVEANSWTSGYELIRNVTAMALLHDAGGLAVVVRNSQGKPVEILCYDPGRIVVRYAADGSGEPSYSLDGKALAAADVLHVRSPFGRSPVSLGCGAIDTAAAMETHARKIFENGAKPSAVIQVPKGMGEDAIKNMKSSFRSAYEGTANAGKTVFIYDGVTFTAAEMKSTDAQFLELRRFQVEEIGRAFGLSPSMLGDLTRSSYANAAQKHLEFLSDSLEPWLCALESAFNRVLLSDEERRDLTFKFDRDDLSRVDLQTRANAINSLVASTVISPNQAAGWIGMGPHEGGDTFENKNVKPAADQAPPNV
jgi:HK97 family phage portal protein